MVYRRAREENVGMSRPESQLLLNTMPFTPGRSPRTYQATGTVEGFSLGKLFRRLETLGPQVRRFEQTRIDERISASHDDGTNVGHLRERPFRSLSEWIASLDIRNARTPLIFGRAR